ncbi:MAG: hypothetical protein ACXWTX_01310 [Gallionella sp.]
MTNQIALLRLQDAWRECERNDYHLRHALNSLATTLPMTADKFQQLSDELVQSLDQFILRFSKLQDAMGGRLFPAILQYLQEPYEERPMLDKLNRLEKLGFIERAENWQAIRVTRNKFAHEYPDDYAKNAALINLASSAASEMHQVLLTIQAKFSKEHPRFELGALIAE